VPEATASGAAAPESQTPAGGASGETVIHAGAAANPEIDVQTTGAEVVPGAAGIPYFISSMPAGAAGVELEGAAQSWLSEPSRSLDVYF
jgi:hypothetical protein